MKITDFKTTLVNLPLEKPIATAIHQMKSVGCVLLALETDEGIVGESYVFTLNRVRLKALHEILLGFEHQVLGKDPHFVADIELLAAAEASCISVEHMPWFSPLFNEAMAIEEGYIKVPEQAGIGFTFNQATIKQFKIN